MGGAPVAFHELQAVIDDAIPSIVAHDVVADGIPYPDTPAGPIPVIGTAADGEWRICDIGG